MLISTISKPTIVESKPEVLCKGRFYRGRNNTYYANGKFVQQTSMSFLKRMSCAGCEKCGWEEDMLVEQIDFDCPPIANDIVDGELYTLVMRITGHDFETGYPDEWELEFMRVK